MMNETTHKARRPLVRVRGHYYPTDHVPEAVFQLLDRLRREAADEIDRLIRFLDEIGGDCDEDAAVDDAPLGDDVDLGPSLDANHSINQEKRCAGFANEIEYDEAEREGDELDNGEGEHDGREPDVDFEPSLVSAEGGAIFAQAGGIIDGEMGGLAAPELDRLRARRRPYYKPALKPERIGDEAAFVMVARSRNGAISNVRPLTDAERAKLFSLPVL